jgi:hypothetical protein
MLIGSSEPTTGGVAVRVDTVIFKPIAAPQPSSQNRVPLKIKAVHAPHP